MGQLWNAITSGVVPLIMAALALIVPAAAAYAVAWLKAQTALQEQAVRSAVDHVDALQAPAVEMTGSQAKRAATRLVASHLGDRVPLTAKLSAQIDRVVAEKRRESQP